MPKDRLKELKTAIATKVRTSLEENQWSQQEFADKLGANKSFVSKLLSGEYNLTLKSITQIEAVLGEKILKIEP